MVLGGRISSLEHGEADTSDGADRGGGVTRPSLDQEIEAMRMRLRELEKLQEEIPPASHGHEDPAAAVTTGEKEEVDARSIFVGNVDYDCSPEEIQQHFQSCGTINRVTILADHFGHPKGFAYVEFLEVEAVQNALMLNETELHDRPLKVCQKRTNIPGMNQPRGWLPHQPFYPFYPTYGKAPRFRRPYRFNPYY